MARANNARIAGVTYFVYVVAGIAALALVRQAQTTSVLDLVTSFSALVLT
jgi:isoprenylcysteine carboxyl methyltransferase (ICMT) family protein YpbQ